MEKTTHYLVPAAMKDELDTICAGEMGKQAKLLRAAVGAMLDEWGQADGHRLPEWPTLPAGPLVSLVFRLPEHMLKALKALEDQTRVKRSHWLRMALHELLEKHGTPRKAAA